MNVIDKLQIQTETWPDGIQARLDEGIVAFEEKLDSLLDGYREHDY